MRIYTKTGDKGQTGLIGGQRVPKNHPRIEACGEVDELNAALGLVRCQKLDPPTDALLDRVQRDLFSLGAALAMHAQADSARPGVLVQRVAEMESEIDRREDGLAPLRQFILPGGHVVAAQLHCARAICRRAERAVVALHTSEAVPPTAIEYLNRLSDLLFVMARGANLDRGVEDVEWEEGS